MSRRITLFKKYVLIFGALTGCSLLLSGLLNINLAYQDSKQAVIRLQREKAEAAAAKIGQYLFDVEQRISVITTSKQGASALDQRRQDIQYLRHIAAISEIYLLDSHGREYFRVSRHAADVLLSGTDFSSSDVFRLPKSGRLYRSPIYFRDGAPLMTVAMAVGPEEAGITVAEVYLEFLLDGIIQIKVGNSGHAYAVDTTGLLIAHPDIGQVFKKTSMAALPQVRAALKEPTDNNLAHVQALSLDGKPVLSAFGTIPQLGWFVFVEEPLAEAYRPLYSQVIRSALLVLFGIFITLFVCLAVVRRLMKPIHSLQEGATLIARGVLDHCIAVSTGDELEDLASEFNNMAKQLQISYATLESKVIERTHVIARINEDLTAREVLLQNILDRYRIMFMDSPDPYLIIRDDVFVDCNRATEAMLRGDRAQIIGRTPDSLSPEFQPDGKKSSQSAEEKIEEAFRNGSNTFEWVHHRFDGTEIFVEVTIASMQLEGKLSLFTSWRDITGRKQAEEALARSEIKFRTLFDSTREAVMLLNEDGFFDCNRACLEMFGCATLEEFCTTHPGKLSPPLQQCGMDSFVLANSHIATAMNMGSHNFEWVHQRADNGKLFPAEVQLSAMELDGKTVLQATVRNITDRKQAEEALKESKRALKAISITDALTGIANRRRFDEALNQEHARHARSGAELSLIMLDIDHFKAFNDNYGHLGGDDCLRRIGRVLADCASRPADLAARYGGEEFACILPETNRSGAVIIAERIRRGIQALAIPHKKSATADYVTASLGVVTRHCTVGGSALDIVSQADELLYCAKSRGRNRVEFAAAQDYELTTAGAIKGDFVRMVWDDSFCCDNPQIDAQHQALFQISNELLEAVLSGSPIADVSLLIGRLLDEVGQHFRDEEKILEIAGFPGLSQHIDEHAKLLAKGMELSRQFSASALPIGDLFQFLAYDVVMTHMLGADREYYPFIRNEVTANTL
ncbi:MAG: diguanylate cyclase [Desulfuromonadaceae bacterium]|nr:diguanylate cyclase [Desulfuromonadaceae bacterium]